MASINCENAESFSQGLPLINIINTQFYGNFIKLGGSGGTIGLAILCLLFAKSSQLKTLGRLYFNPINYSNYFLFGYGFRISSIS